MGGSLSSNAYSSLAETCLSTLQDKGFRQFASKGFSLDKWAAISVYGGSDMTRTKSFENTKALLIPNLKAGFEKAQYRIMNTTGFLDDFIACSLAHHVMKCLLEESTAIPINFSEIKKESLFYALPKYEPTKVASFQERWRKNADGSSISLDTTDADEKALLSAKLALDVSQILLEIDMPALVQGAIETYNAAQTKAKASTEGLFSRAAGADAPSLLASREPADDSRPRHK